MPAPLSLEGKTFNRLTIISENTETIRIKRYWNCKCSCGKNAIVETSKLTSGHTKSCGCIRLDTAKASGLKKRGKPNPKRCTHGLGKPPIYGTWVNMKTRCFNKNSTQWKWYGGRGITVCNSWRNDFSAFYSWAINNGYYSALELDRIDNNGPYNPDNCHWITHSQNSRNTRTNRLLTAFGETKCVVDWLNDPRCAAHGTTIIRRIDAGISHEVAISTKGKIGSTYTSWILSTDSRN